MDLYGFLPPTSDASKPSTNPKQNSSAWSATRQTLVPSVLQRRNNVSSSSSSSSSSTFLPSKKSRWEEPPSTSASSHEPSILPTTEGDDTISSSTTSSSSLPTTVYFDVNDIENEYDPIRPNDYDNLVRDYERIEKDRQEQRQRYTSNVNYENNNTNSNQEYNNTDSVAYTLPTSSVNPWQLRGTSSTVSTNAKSANDHDEEDIQFTGLGASSEPSTETVRNDNPLKGRGMDNRPAWMIAAEGSSQARGMDNRPAWMVAMETSTPNDSSHSPTAPSSLTPTTVVHTETSTTTISNLTVHASTIAPSTSLSTSTTTSTASNLSGMSKAARMMAKWGFTVGQGLGKHNEGIVAPLVHEKTSTRSGIIRQADLPLTLSTLSSTFSTITGSMSSSSSSSTFSSSAASSSLSSTTITTTTHSRIVVIRNMMNAEDVDDDLEEEVQEECSRKYGPVEKVTVYIGEKMFVPHEDNRSAHEGTWVPIPSEEKVRVFVQFRDEPTAKKAMEDLRIRYFSGRLLRAALFSEERFRKLDLAPLVYEIQGNQDGKEKG